jgi:flavorubredoxin
MFNPVKIKEGLYWAGAIDWNLRAFHGFTYSTHNGTTYNSYLLIDDKVALIDGVAAHFFNEWRQRVSRVIDPGEIDYFICNHAEPDHSGAIPEMMKLMPKAKIVANQRAKDALLKQYCSYWDFQIVKTGDTLNLGKKALKFIEAPMIHWPDSMFDYLEDDGILFSNDAFGQHYASTERFDDELSLDLIMNENAKYYANILWPLSQVILKKLDEIKKMNIAIKMILTSHGLSWRKHPQEAIESYLRFSRGDSAKKVIIAYDTMYYSTEKMALSILEGILSQEIEARLYRLPVSDTGDIIKDLLYARGLLIGSSVVNNNILPGVEKFLFELKGLHPLNKTASFFGSYGWMKDIAAKSTEEALKDAGMRVALPSLNIKYAPDADELKQCFEFGQKFALEVKKD